MANPDISDRQAPEKTKSFLATARQSIHGWAIERLLRLKFKASSRKLLSSYIEKYDVNERVLSQVSRAWIGRQSDKPITDLRARHLTAQIQRPIARKNYPRLLTLIARFEAIGRNAPVAAGDLIARQMVSEVGRERIRKCAEKALTQSRNSPYLLYLHSVCLAKSGQYVEATDRLSTYIEQFTKRTAHTAEDAKRAKRQFEYLRNAWRTVDLIAREDTAGLDEDRYIDMAVADNQVRKGATNQSWALNFKEPYLQARAEEKYLSLCEQEFRDGETLIIKLKAIKEMIREGVRRQLTYHRGYSLARSSFDTLRPDLDKLTARAASDFADAKAATNATQTLVLAIEASSAIGFSADVQVYKSKLVEWSASDLFQDSRWSILPALVDDAIGQWGNVSQMLRGTLKRPPANEGQLKAFLKWAMHMRAFQDAERIFVALPSALRGSQAALYFVNILQRQSRFAEALQYLKPIHAYMLSKPASMNPYQHWALVRRYGELRFLHQTATVFRRAKQPTKPRGVLIVGARNIDQLRKYPLAVLAELRRRGWAVIPLVEGLLPRDMTGVREIDRLHGCITIEGEISLEASGKFEPLVDYRADVRNGLLTWGNIDLSHCLLEDARVARRAFHVDLTCPSLEQNLSRLADWTALFGQALTYARNVLPGLGLRCGVMSLFNSRLPDAVFRFFCDEFGDPATFFCLHTANGYENYFRNFKTSISTRCVIRNVTKYPFARASSMPIPALFEAFYNKQKNKIDDILQKIEYLSNIKRTTGGLESIDPEAAACEKRILDWRERGGKVVGLFGRVVCDSAVPFDGGPAHADLVDWLNHSIESVRGTDTLLLIKPHPHELNDQIATYINEYFTDLIVGELPENVIILKHRWFDIQAMKKFIDLGTIYNGTAAIDLALMDLPVILCNHFAPIDYSVGHPVPRDRDHYAAMLQFREPAESAPDLRARAAVWLYYMSETQFVLDYRYHARPITNRVVYPPYWIEEDVEKLKRFGDRNVSLLASRVIGTFDEPRS